VPLTGVSIAAEITWLCARVVVSQRSVNRETKPIEAVYVFPLEEGAAVCGFEAIVDDTLIVGEVKEREKAFDSYDDAIAAGHGAFLLDEERPDVFQASVGNLPPGKDVLLRPTYVTELTAAAGELRFSIPTTVAPRYAPAEDRTGVGRSDADALNPPLRCDVPYGVDLSVKLAMPDAITRIESPSHPTAAEVAGQTATVTLSQRSAALDRDFVLSVATKGFDGPHAWVERTEDGGAAVGVAFVPAFDAASRPAEVVFLVDRSGSMEGTSPDAAAYEAAPRFARSAVPEVLFSRAARPPASAPPPMIALVRLQTAAGHWELNEELAHVLGLDLRELRHLLDGATGDRAEAACAWATALALAWLERRAARFEDEWVLLADKGHRWLAQVHAEPGAGRTWIEAAKTIVRR
jgi:hypothetical protein